MHGCRNRKNQNVTMAYCFISVQQWAFRYMEVISEKAPALTAIFAYDIMNPCGTMMLFGRECHMLKILDENVLKTDDEIENLYKNCKYLYTIDGYEKMTDDAGYLYCVSMSEDSFEQLYDMRDRLRAAGKICVVGGSYNNGGAIGVQYEIKM